MYDPGNLTGRRGGERGLFTLPAAALGPHARALGAWPGDPTGRSVGGLGGALARETSLGGAAGSGGGGRGLPLHGLFTLPPALNVPIGIKALTTVEENMSMVSCHLSMLNKFSLQKWTYDNSRHKMTLHKLTEVLISLKEGKMSLFCTYLFYREK